MRRFRLASCLLVCGAVLIVQQRAHSDVTLTFDQGVVGNGTILDEAYGDRVTVSPDGNGYEYGVTGGGAPNVEVTYNALQPRLWTTGYGNLTNVYYNEADFSDAVGITLTADSGFEVGLLGFDMAAFSGNFAVPGIEVRDGADTLLWSASPTPVTISGSTSNQFDFGTGIFANELTLTVDLTGLGGASDNIGIDNVRFTQVAAIPEPSSTGLLALGLMAIASRRTRRNTKFG